MGTNVLHGYFTLTPGGGGGIVPSPKTTGKTSFPFKLLASASLKRGIWVSSTFVLAGGAAEQAGTIEAGDEILAINGKPLVGLVHFDAWNIMKSVPEGPVQLVIRKHRNPWVLASIPSPRLTSFSKSEWLRLRTDGLWNQYTADTDIHDCTLHHRGWGVSFHSVPAPAPPHTHICSGSRAHLFF